MVYLLATVVISLFLLSGSALGQNDRNDKLAMDKLAGRAQASIISIYFQEPNTNKLRQLGLSFLRGDSS